MTKSPSMISVLVYRVNRYLLKNNNPREFVFPAHGADWLRSVVLKLMVKNRKKLEQLNVNTSVFHNHDEKTGKPLIRYPMVIYAQKDNEFYITGINEGALALKSLMDLTTFPLRLNDQLIMTFEHYNSTEIELKNLKVKKCYSITDWLPFTIKEFKELQGESAIKILKLLEDKLTKHIINDLGKYLNYDLNKTKVEIMTFPSSLSHHLSFSHNRKFKPFSFEFSVNAVLPDFLCLGYEKAVGFGSIEQLVTN